MCHQVPGRAQNIWMRQKGRTVAFTYVRLITGLPPTENTDLYTISVHLSPDGGPTSARLLPDGANLECRTTWALEYGSTTSSICFVLLAVPQGSPIEVARVTLPIDWFPPNTVVKATFPMRLRNRLLASEIAITLDIHRSEDGRPPFCAEPGPLLVKLVGDAEPPGPNSLQPPPGYRSQNQPIPDAIPQNQRPGQVPPGYPWPVPAPGGYPSLIPPNLAHKPGSPPVTGLYGHPAVPVSAQKPIASNAPQTPPGQVALGYPWPAQVPPGYPCPIPAQNPLAPGQKPPAKDAAPQIPYGYPYQMGPYGYPPYGYPVAVPMQTGDQKGTQMVYMMSSYPYPPYGYPPTGFQ
jgi:hypothetical protein